MTLTVEDKAKIIDAYRVHATDTGSAEVQIALLTTRIRQLTDHLKSHRNDHASRRGLLMMVGRRSTFLKYLRTENEERYNEIVKKLDLRR